MPVAETAGELALPLGNQLLPNYPNPFNASTQISFTLTESAANHPVELSIFNVLGEQVVHQVLAVVKTGLNKITLNADKLESGIYFYQIKANRFSETRRMVVIK